MKPLKRNSFVRTDLGEIHKISGEIRTVQGEIRGVQGDLYDCTSCYEFGHRIV